MVSVSERWAVVSNVQAEVGPGYHHRAVSGLKSILVAHPDSPLHSLELAGWLTDTVGLVELRIDGK